MGTKAGIVDLRIDANMNMKEKIRSFELLQISKLIEITSNKVIAEVKGRKDKFVILDLKRKAIISKMSKEISEVEKLKYQDQEKFLFFARDM